MDAGVKLLKEGRYNEALEAFQEGFRIYPDRGFILDEATTLFEAGRYAEASLAYERYFSDPDAPRADEARDALERARAKLGGREVTESGVAESRRLFEKGQQAFAAGRCEEALDAFQDAYELNPMPALKYDQASCLEKLGRLYAAADSYLAYASANPKAHDALDALARVDKLRAQADAGPITASGAAGGQEWITRGNRLLMAGRSDEAAAAFQEGFRTYPDRAFILNKASALLDGGRYAEADLAYQTYLSDPDAPRAGDARAAQERARAHLGGREATITGVAESGRLFEKATELYKAGRYGEAVEAFDRAYALNPVAQIRYNQAACLDMLGKRELAAQRYEAYLKEAPGASDAGQVQTRITKLRGDALTAAREAFDRGQVAFRAGRFKDAASEFAAAYEQKPLPEFLFNRAAALEQSGDTARAVQTFQLYLSMAPNAADADKVRVHIQKLQQASGNELMRP
jgi:tetratricopeptide (TPR) repeat protein